MAASTIPKSVNDLLVQATTQILTITLASGNGGTYKTLAGSDYSITVPSGYTFVANIYCAVSGWVGMDAHLETMPTIQTPNVYIFNGGAAATSTTIKVIVYTLWMK